METIGLISTNWNGYTVYSDGTILNKDGTKKSLKVSKKGYQFTNFYVEGRLICRSIQRVVWMAFNGDVPEGYEVDHKDNVRCNNHLDNLQLLTKSANNQKSYDAGHRIRKFYGTPSWRKEQNNAIH